MLLNRPAINRRLEAERLKAAAPVTIPKEQINKADVASKASPKRKTGASRKPRSKRGKDA